MDGVFAVSLSSRLRLPFLLPQQAQKHVTLNETLRLLDALVATAVVSDRRVDEPETADEGDLFILPAGATGPAWGAMPAHALALYENGGFQLIEPVVGQVAFVRERRELVLFDGAGWTGAPFRTTSQPLLAVNADPDPRNRLVVAADSELLTHDARTPGSGDARKIINKRDAARTASVVFQSAFSGRAEFGLAGNDDVSLRVSSDGTAFRDVLRVSNASGRVAIGVAAAAPACALDVAGPVRVGSFAKAALPPANAGAGQIAFVSDESGGATLAFSDGVLWRRVADRAAVS